MSDFSTNILNHPDKDEIISKLVTGVDVRSVSEWLKIKYSAKEDAHLRLPITLLTAFAKSPYMDCYDKFKNDVTAIQQGKDDEIDKKVFESIVNNKSYAERLHEVASEEVNMKKEIVNLLKIFSSRYEQVFDSIQDDPRIVGKKDDIFTKMTAQHLSILDKCDKILNNAPDQIIQHNYTVEYINEQTTLLQDAVRSVISEMNPEDSMYFLDKFSKALTGAKPTAYKVLSLSEKRGMVDALEGEIVTDEKNG